MWGKDAGDPTSGFYPWFSTTTYGKRVLESGEIIPHDSYDYLVRIKKAVPQLDEIVLQYIEESLQCYLDGNLMAASVMLGVASEAALYRLLDSFKKSIHVNPRAIEKAEKLENRISTTDKFKVVYDEIQDKKKDLEPSLAEVIEYNLNGIFNLTGHPTGTRPDKDQMYANLIVFIMYCKTLYDLIKWLEH
jgi:hypothetical protein